MENFNIYSIINIIENQIKIFRMIKENFNLKKNYRKKHISSLNNETEKQIKNFISDQIIDENKENCVLKLFHIFIGIDYEKRLKQLSEEYYYIKEIYYDYGRLEKDNSIIDNSVFSIFKFLKIEQFSYDFPDPIEIFFYFLDYIENKNNIIIYLEIIFILFYDNMTDIQLTKYFNFLNIKSFYIKEGKGREKLNFIENYYKNKNYSYIEELITKIYICYKINFSIEYFFNCFSKFVTFSLYNIQNINGILGLNYFLDKQYLEYLEKINSKQKIKLLCIIDNHKYSFNNNIITYKYIDELYFIIDEYNLSEAFNVPYKEIYSILLKYITSLKYKENLKIITFSKDFFIYNSQYDNTLINCLLDQYYSDIDYALNKINLDINNIMGDDHEINNSIIYLFPNLIDSKTLRLKYDANKNKIIGNIEFGKEYLIVNIDFNNNYISKLNIIIDLIINFFNNHSFEGKKFVEYLSFLNFKLKDIKDFNDLNIKCISGYLGFNNLKFFCINNKAKNPIINNFNLVDIKRNNLSYLGLGSSGDLIFYRYNFLKKLKLF